MNYLKKIIILPFYLIFYFGKFYSNFLKFLNITFYTKWHDLCFRENDKDTLLVIHNSEKEGKIDLKFFTPNSRSKNRAATFSKKEPETLMWIENQQKGECFFDIGSNIGLYSIYNAKINKGKTFSFEPSGLNSLQLIKNINLNELQDKIVVITNPLANEDKISSLFLDKYDAGASEVFFGKEIIKEIRKKKTKDDFFYDCLGLTIDKLVEDKILPIPNYVKIDVDGSEEDILKGAKTTISNDKCKSILIEINDVISSNSCENFLKECNFKCVFRNDNNNNQIWEK